MMKFVLASHNPGKLAEMQRILGQLGVEVVLPVRVGAGAGAWRRPAPPLRKTPCIKAEAVMQASGLPAIADDSGLCVDALNGAPGCLLRPLRRLGLTTWPAIGCCWRTCGGPRPVRPTSTRRWSAASPTGTC